MLVSTPLVVPLEQRPALFLDRDGVINKEKHYLYKIEEFELLPGVVELCAEFQAKGYYIIVVTNQAGIARGYYSEVDFLKLSKWMQEFFTSKGIFLSSVKYCPHHPDGKVNGYNIQCDCRKPKPGLILKAKEEFCIDMKRSLLIGDKKSDIVAGVKAGVGKNYLVETGHVITSDDMKLADGCYKNLNELRSEIGYSLI